jgi:para-nitrobenzyl esterase
LPVVTAPIVETTPGRVEGAERDGVRVWRGIPFAAAPTGRRRFELPVPPAPWTGVRPALDPGPAPLQPVMAPLGASVPGMVPATIDEDCLTLDVWAPPGSADAGTGGAAVMVWIPGGAFVIGAGSLPTYDGARLAAEGGVVVVSVNYRVGILGFSAFAEGHANLGLVDLCAALAWVQENAAAFGGDPDRVTVFGESAGGGAICHLLATRLARGLFRRAIVQSGATGFTQTIEQARRATTRTAEAAAETAATADAHVAGAGDLRALDADALLAAQGRALVDLMPELGAMPFHPCVDLGVVKRTPLEALTAGDAAGVELLIGTTAHEMRLYVDVREELSRERLRTLVRREVGSEADADALLAAYEATGPPSPAHTWSDVRTDADLTLWAERLAAAQSVHQPRTYRYVFTWEAAAEGGRLGACHAVDLPFTFGTFGVDGWGAFVDAGPEAERVGRDLRDRWTAFARDGVPGADWPAYDTARRATRIIGREPGVVDDPRGGVRAAWAAVALNRRG